LVSADGFGFLFDLPRFMTETPGRVGRLGAKESAKSMKPVVFPSNPTAAMVAGETVRLNPV